MGRRIVTSQLQTSGSQAGLSAAGVSAESQVDSYTDRVVKFQTSGSLNQVDSYTDRVVKLIPGDVVVGWTFLSSLISDNQDPDVPRVWLLWAVFAFLLLFTAYWTHIQTAEPSLPPAIRQIVISTMAFAVWVFALGGPFLFFDWYRPLYGTILLALFTFLAAAIPTNSDNKTSG
jgi:hypothetical protein